MTESKQNDYQTAKAELDKIFGVMHGLLDEREDLLAEIEMAEAQAGEQRAEALLSGKTPSKAGASDVDRLKAKLAEHSATEAAVNRRWLAALRTEREAFRIQQELIVAGLDDASRLRDKERERLVAQLDQMDIEAKREQDSRRGAVSAIDQAREFLDGRVGVWRGSPDEFEEALDCDPKLAIDRGAGRELVKKWCEGHMGPGVGGNFETRYFPVETVVFFEKQSGAILDSGVTSATNSGGLTLRAGRTMLTANIPDHRAELEAQFAG